MSAEALANALASYWPQPLTRVAERILADPAPLLAALAEAGVLVEQWGHYNPSVGDVRIDEDEAEARAMVEFWDDPDTCRVVHRYVTDWQEVQA